MDDFAPLQEPYQGSRAAFHAMIVSRIYHEDNLFAQRSYVLLGVHAFLLTAFAVLLTSQKPESIWWIAIPITLFGSFLGMFQAAFGRQTGRAVGFWRVYLRMIEEKWEIPFDRLQYDFYARAKAETPFGAIGKKKDSQKALYQLYKRALFFTSVISIIGLFFPAGLGLFWAASLGYVIHKILGTYCLAVVVFLILALLEAIALRPSLAKAHAAIPETNPKSG
jgi:hypothetical protein